MLGDKSYKSTAVLVGMGLVGLGILGSIDYTIPKHHVKSHTVRAYRRKDGTFVRGYLRGGRNGYLSKDKNAKKKLTFNWGGIK